MKDTATAMGLLTRIASNGTRTRLDLCLRPWKINWSGHDCCLGTDGKVLVLARRAPPEGLEHVKVVDIERVLSYLKHPVQGNPVRLSAFKQWAGVPVWSEETACRLCRGRRRAECPDCAYDGDICSMEHGTDGLVPCPECDGKGKYDVFPSRLGKIGDTAYNRNYFACLLEPCEDEEVLLDFQAMPGHKIAVLNARAWRMFFMPVVTSKRLIEESPALEIPA